MPENLGSAVSRRRTFAIISHPDAGKTTLTEKLLLYGGAIHLAGTVKSRKSSRHATSDWMEIEKQRGISVTSSVMQFQYNGFHINILDTPGHQDFSEDTYRTLCAADAAVMLIDGAKGVEPQTIKLFSVARQRGLPIFTLINKMDRATQDPFHLIDELEKVLGIRSVPVNWPIGESGHFKGVYNRKQNQVELYEKERQDHGASVVKVNVTAFDDSSLSDLFSGEDRLRLASDIELLEIAGDEWDTEKVLAGELTPVFFGSALSNFGISFFLNEFLALAPPPLPRRSNEGLVRPEEDDFSGFVFKIQTNMNPEHRDRMAFIRICSGRYSKGMTVQNTRLKRSLHLTFPQQLMAREHSVVEEAYAGDIIGVFDSGSLKINDTLTVNRPQLVFEPIPVFPPEHFARVRPEDSLKRKQFVKGLNHLAEEGAIQLFKEPDIGTETYIVGVIGLLQLDVLNHRLIGEYGVAISQTLLQHQFARRLLSRDEKPLDLDELKLTSGTMLVLDSAGEPVLLFDSQWGIQWAIDKNPTLSLDSIGL